MTRSRLSLIAPVASLSLMALGGCVERVVYRDRPVEQPTVAAVCSPDYPCTNTYYWDEFRYVYVYYDGYQYYDATGYPGAYPLPPATAIIYSPPVGYVPPSAP